MAEGKEVHFGDEGDPPGPFNLCFHYLKPMHRCTKKPGHEGDHWYSKFTVTDVTDTVTDTEKEN